MAETKIEWADKTWNPISGCSPVSEACDHCYARRMANRLRGRCGYPADDPFRVTFHEDRLYKVINRLKPQRIFVCSMSDIAHPEVKLDWFRRIMSIIESNPESTYMMLTKRPDVLAENIRALGNIPFAQKTVDDFDFYWHEKLPLKNLWLGVTAENQNRADERIPILLQIPAAVHFVSVEPGLSRVDLQDYLPFNGHTMDSYHGEWMRTKRTGISWAITGAETGPGARYMDPAWARDLLAQCRAAGVPFFFKKMSKNQPIPADLMVREFPTV